MLRSGCCMRRTPITQPGHGPIPLPLQQQPELQGQTRQREEQRTTETDGWQQYVNKLLTAGVQDREGGGGRKTGARGETPHFIEKPPVLGLSACSMLLIMVLGSSQPLCYSVFLLQDEEPLSGSAPACPTSHFWLMTETTDAAGHGHVCEGCPKWPQPQDGKLSPP